MTTMALALGWTTLLAIAGPVAQPRLSERVTLALVAQAEEIIERTPARLSVEMQKTKDEDIVVALVVKPFYQRHVELRYRHLPEEFRTLSYTSEWDTPGHPEFHHFRLKGRQRDNLELSFAVDVARRAFIFDRPGDYELQLRCHVTWYSPADILETPVVRVRVAPAPPSEAVALADWDVDLAMFAQDDGSDSGGAPSTRALEKALRFMDAHPNSLYSELLRTRALKTLESFRRDGDMLTDVEQDWYERLRPGPTQQ